MVKLCFLCFKSDMYYICSSTLVVHFLLQLALVGFMLFYHRRFLQVSNSKGERETDYSLLVNLRLVTLPFNEMKRDEQLSVNYLENISPRVKRHISPYHVC